MIRADSPLTEEIIALILAYMAENARDTAFVEAVSRVSAAIIEDEVKYQAALLSLEYTIDPIALAQEWILLTTSRIHGITDTTALQVKRLLYESLKNNDTIVQTAQKLTQLFGEMNKGRAALIARTEVLGATNFASFRTYQIAGVPFKRWLATMDDRVRDSHANANGQLRGVSEAFDIGGSAMMYPGDPDGPASEVINCRCTLVPEMQARLTIWTIQRLVAIWKRYVIRAVSWDDKMLTSVQHEFESQHFGIASILHRYI